MASQYPDAGQRLPDAANTDALISAMSGPRTFIALLLIDLRRFDGNAIGKTESAD